jgi:hypothetical protein
VSISACRRAAAPGVSRLDERSGDVSQLHDVFRALRGFGVEAAEDHVAGNCALRVRLGDAGQLNHQFAQSIGRRAHNLQQHVFVFRASRPTLEQLQFGTHGCLELVDVSALAHVNQVVVLFLPRRLDRGVADKRFQGARQSLHHEVHHANKGQARGFRRAQQVGAAVEQANGGFVVWKHGQSLGRRDVKDAAVEELDRVGDVDGHVLQRLLGCHSTLHFFSVAICRRLTGYGGAMPRRPYKLSCLSCQDNE